MDNYQIITIIISIISSGLFTTFLSYFLNKKIFELQRQNLEITNTKNIMEMYLTLIAKYSNDVEKLKEETIKIKHEIELSEAENSKIRLQIDRYEAENPKLRLEIERNEAKIQELLI